jgi:uncharacterized membrane protein YraQ (UPF0718 family)
MTDANWRPFDLGPAMAAVLFALWMACPVLTLVGLLMLRRALRVPFGWAQVLASLSIAATIWWQFTRIELP